MTATASADKAAPRDWRAPSGTVIQNYLFGSWTVLVFAFLYIPILLLVVYSFNDSLYAVSWNGFTTKWYGALLKNEQLLGALKNSLIVASITTVLSTVLGTIGAWMLYRYRFPMHGSLGLLIFIPMVMPEILMGVSLRTEFVNLLHLPLGHAAMIIAHTTFCFPFVLVGMQARLHGLDPFLEEAAMDLGAPPIKAFWLVIVPYLMPAIISGALMCFTLSLDEYIVSVFTFSADSQTLPIKVYGMLKAPQFGPQVRALSTLFIVATIALVLISQMLTQRKST